MPTLAVLHDGAPPLLDLVSDLLEAQARALGTGGRGLAQGSPLVPLLANLCLDALDEEIDGRGVKIVRFADDFVILCKSQKRAEKALAHSAAVLADHGLELHAEESRVVNFDKGFDFVGYLFMRTLALKEGREPKPKPAQVKSEITEEGVIQLDDAGSRFDQRRKVLYVLDPDNELAVRKRSFSVRRGDGAELLAVNNRRVARQAALDSEDGIEL